MDMSPGEIKVKGVRVGGGGRRPTLPINQKARDRAKGLWKETHTTKDLKQGPASTLSPVAGRRGAA